MAWFDYLSGMLALLAATWQTWRVTTRLLRPLAAWMVTVFQLALLLYLAALIPGIISCLTAGGIALTLVVLSMVAIFFWTWLGRKMAPLAPPAAATPTNQPVYNAGVIALAVLGILGLTPVIAFVGQLPFELRQDATILEWDTVSYHLPALIEFLQQKTLWYEGGAYSSYSFGYELLAALPVACFHGSWPLVASHLLALTLFFSALCFLAESLTKTIALMTDRLIASPVVCLLASGIVARLFAMEMGKVGKNDIYQNACLLAAVGGILEYRQYGRQGITSGIKKIILTLVVVALGLALSAKSNALAYVPILAGVAGLAVASQASSGRIKWLERGRVAAAVFIGTGALGGFFLLRNLWMMGRVVSADLAFEVDNSLLYLTGDIHNWLAYDGAKLILAAALAVVVPMYFAWRGRGRMADSWPVYVLLGLHLAAAGIFFITPSSVPAPGFLHMRLALFLFCLAAIWIGVVMVQLASSLANLPRWPVFRLSLFAGLLVAGIGLPLYFAPTTSPGLPNYEIVRGLPPTHIYQAVQNLNWAQDRPLRIYAAGLQPLGLYGPNYANQVFYDLHSDTTHYNHQTPGFLMAILQQFKPDLIILSVDPYPSDQPPIKPPLVDWMRHQPCFVEIYNDATVSAFEVTAGWESLLKAYPPQTAPLRMGY